MSNENILSAFKKQLVAFIDELIEQFPECVDFIIMRIFINDQSSIKNIIKLFIKDILPLKELIQNRDDNFFLKTEFICYPKKPDFFKDFWFSNLLDNEDKKIIWKWMDVFVLLAQKYK